MVLSKTQNTDFVFFFFIYFSWTQRKKNEWWELDIYLEEYVTRFVFKSPFTYSLFIGTSLLPENSLSNFYTIQIFFIVIKLLLDIFLVFRLVFASCCKLLFLHTSYTLSLTRFLTPRSSPTLHLTGSNLFIRLYNFSVGTFVTLYTL